MEKENKFFTHVKTLSEEIPSNERNTSRKCLDYYWSLKIKEESGKEHEIWLHADDVQVNINGDLTFYKIKNENRLPIFSVKSGIWVYFGAASIIDGSLCYVEHWDEV